MNGLRTFSVQKSITNHKKILNFGLSKLLVLEVCVTAVVSLINFQGKLSRLYTLY